MTASKRIALLGAAGFVGSAIGRALARRPDVIVIPVSRGDDWATSIEHADFVVHCANPARRFQAESDPRRDFQETVEKTASFLKFKNGKPFLLVSTLSCRTQSESRYGKHRLACEQIALVMGASVVRLGPMYGGSRTRDSLHDIILGKPVFVSASTCYAYVDVDWVGFYIASNLESFPNAVTEIGARNTIALSEIARHLGSTSSFADRDDTQFPLDFSVGPDAYGVLKYAQAEAVRVDEWRS
jgi:uncharacterized protein YbjT (DUF2867 family)